MADRTPAPRMNSEDAQADLLATLAASRELGPEMDKTLVESYMQKHGQPLAPVAPQQAEPPAMPHPAYQGLAAIGPVLGIAVYIVMLIASGGQLWWMFWLPMALGGWCSSMFWGSGNHGATRDEWRYRQRMARDQMRYDRRTARDQYRAARHGYGYPPAPYEDPRLPAGYPDYPPPTVDPRQQAPVPSAPSTPPTPPVNSSREVL